jgi:RNA polymerase sigma factor (sigma-70 family)
MVEHPGNGVVQRLHNLLALGVAAEQGDVDLLRRFTAQGDAAAFAALVRRHGPMVLGVCRRLLRDSTDADDAFQATFAILVRKAASISHPERLAGWLFQVAYRTARRARSARLRRQSRELPLTDVPVEAPIADFVWRELQPIFDEEVNRLPERFRLPVVLCLMGGRTKRTAAKLLDWPEGTFCSRLQRARELLRGRLARRGVTLPSSALTLALVQGTTSTAVPSSLLAVTTQSALLVATGSALPAPVAILAHGVIHSMLIAKLKVVGALVLTVAVVGGGTGLLLQGGDGRSGSTLAKQPGQMKDQIPKDARPGANQIEEKEPVRVSEVMIVGNTVTKDNIIRRALNFYPGQILSYPELIQAEERLKRLGIFEVDPSKGIHPTVEVENPEVDEPWKSIVVKVQEKTGKFIELVDAERALAQLKAAADDLEENKRTLAQATITIQDGLAKALAEKAIQQEKAVRESKKALEKAQATLKVKDAQLARLQQLFQTNTVKPMELDHAKAELELARAQLARAEAIQEEVRQNDNNKKPRVLQIKELSSELIEAEAALAQLDAATGAIKYYESNLDIEQKANSSISAIVGAKASLAKAIAEKASKEWDVIRAAKKAQEKAESTLKLNEAELNRVQQMFLRKAASQNDLDRAKNELEVTRTQLDRAQTLLDARGGARTLVGMQPLEPNLKDDDISRGLRIKDLSTELIEAEIALSELRAITEGVKYCDANLKIEEQSKSSNSAILAAKAALNKANAEKANKQWNTIRTAKKAQEKAEATLKLNEAELKRLQQMLLEKSAMQKDLDGAKTELERTRAQLDRATSILDAFSGTETEAVKQLGQPRPVDSKEAKIGDAAVAEAEAKLERLMKLKAGGAASDAEIEEARIAVANARIAYALRTIVDTRQKAMDRAQRLREANVITADELKKAADALEAAKRRQAEWK